MEWILLIIVLLIAVLMYMRWRNQESEINLDDLLMENGRMSKISVVFLGSWVFSTWLMVFMTLNDKMTEGLFMAYGGLWIAPIVARIIRGDSNGSASKVLETNSGSTAVSSNVSGGGKVGE